jgi:hypothetical protein
MMILVPFKPLVLVLGLMSGFIFAGFIGSSLLQGKAPFAPRNGEMRHAVAKQDAIRATSEHKRLHKGPSARAE